MKGIPIPTVTIEPGQNIDPPLPERVAGLLDGILQGARDNFERDENLCPIFFAMKGDQITPCLFKEFTPDMKQHAFKWMQEQVPLNEACVFVVETWFARAMKSEFKEGPDDCLVRPSERSDRREMVMVNLFTPDRKVSIAAEITRNPTQLGPWELFSDTAKEGELHAEGPMIGIPFKEKGQK